MARGFLDEQISDGSVGRRGSAFSDHFVEIAAVVERGLTGKARRFNLGTKTCFVPFSQMSAETRNEVKGLEVGARITLCLSEWFCKQEGLI